MPARNLWTVSAFLIASIGAHAQWLNQKTPGTPRTKTGKPILTAPAPRTANGKPDLSGVWQAAASPIPDLIKILGSGANGLGESIPAKYFIDILADYPFDQEPLQPAIRAAFHPSPTAVSKNDPSIHCLPAGTPAADLLPAPFKFVQTPSEIMMMFEAGTTFRQIHTDGRKLPDDPWPSWMGYSVGKWMGDILVVETNGLNNRGWLDAMGHTHSEDLRVTEGFHRRDFGHMELELTLNDPKTFTKPVTIKAELVLLPDTDLLEYFCSEGEKDLAHVTLE